MSQVTWLEGGSAGLTWPAGLEIVPLHRTFPASCVSDLGVVLPFLEWVSSDVSKARNSHDHRFFGSEGVAPAHSGVSVYAADQGN